MASGSFDFTADGVLQGRIVWSSTSKGAISNSSDVSATLYARRTDTYGPTYGQSWSGYVKVGTAQTNISFSSSVAVGDSWVEMAKVSTNIAHNADGSKSVAISGSVTGPSGTSLANRTSSGSSTVTLDKIARYTSITSFSVDKRNETSFTFKWQTADIIDYAWYSTDNGSTWAGYNVTDGTSGSFVVSKLSSNTDTNLSANTAYNCKLRVRRKDSQLNTDSSTVKQTTYDYPYCTSTPNFTIGEKTTLNFYNPLSRNITFYIIANGTQIANSWNISTTSYTGIDGATTLEQLYATIPNANSGKYQVKVVYGSSTKTRNNGNTFSVNVNNSKPTFSNFDYDDTNSTTLALTGNSKILVKGYSNNKITISTTNKATAKNSATMSSYQASQGTKSAKANYSSSAAVTMSMSAVDNNVITVTAIDSRKNSTSAVKTLNSTYYKEYSALVIKTATAKRSNNGVGQNVTLAFNGTFWNNSFGSVSNDITSATYQYKETTSSSWSSATALTVSKSGANFSYSGTIKGDLAADGFSVEKSFNIRVTVKDKLTTKTYNIILGSGTPAIAIYKDKVAIGKKYDTSIGGALQIADNVFLSKNSATHTGYSAKREDTGTEVRFGVGSGGINHGIWSMLLNKWIIFGDDSKIYLDGENITIDNGIMQGFLQHHGNAPTNLNNARTNGIYMLGGSSYSNSPTANPYGILIVYESRGTTWTPSEATTGTSWIWQEMRTTNGAVYRRNAVNESSSWSSWSRQYSEVVLYNDGTGIGTNGNVTLSESSANFNYIEIFYYKIGCGYNNVRVAAPNGRTVNLILDQIEDGIFQILAKKVRVSGTSINLEANKRAYCNFSAGGGTEINTDENEIYINRVVGYR